MTVTASPELVAYMRKKGYTHVVVGIVDSKTCCAGFSDIVTSFVNDKGAEKLHGKIRRTLPCEDMQDVLVTAPGLEYDEDISLGLKSFLGAKDITVKGIRAWSI